MPGLATAPAWIAGFQNLDVEHHDEVALPVSGKIPPALQGTLYRIGPARHEVAGERYRHWFDGDGMIHALRLDGGTGEVGYRNRFVTTTKKLAEDRAGRRIFATFGTPPAGNAVQRVRHFRPANSANTNVLRHAERLWALCEAGKPHRIDPDTLETVSRGEDDLDILGRNDTFTAHPKHHPSSGALVGFGMHVGARPELRVYRIAANSRAEQLAAIPLGGASFVHDFALTDTRAVFVLGRRGGPSMPPVGFLLGRTSVHEGMRAAPGPTDLWTVDLRTGAVDHRPAPDGLLGFSHVAGAFDTDDGGYVVDGVVYPDSRIVDQMVDLMAGREADLAQGRLVRLEVSRSGAATASARAEVAFEFPRCIDSVATSQHHTVWGLTGFLGAPVRVDDGGTVDVHPLAPGEFAGEPIPVPKAGASAEVDAWVLSVVLSTGDQATSELRILDGADLQAPPVATVPLPNVVPFDFHGSWVAAAG